MLNQHLLHFTLAVKFSALKSQKKSAEGGNFKKKSFSIYSVKSKEIDISQRSLAFSSPSHTSVSPLIPFWGDVTTVIIGSVQKLFYCDECQTLPDINKVLLQS